jgi:hypothetical protein
MFSNISFVLAIEQRATSNVSLRATAGAGKIQIAMAMNREMNFHES